MKYAYKMKKPTTALVISSLVVLLGILQLIREIFGLGTWHLRGYIEKYEGIGYLIISLIESPGLWIIICSLSYYHLHKKGGQLLWGAIAIQAFFLFAMYREPMAKLWFVVVWPLFAFVIYHGKKYNKTENTNSDILDDPDF